MRNRHFDSDWTSGFLFSTRQARHRARQSGACHHVYCLCFPMPLGLSQTVHLQWNTIQKKGYHSCHHHQHRLWRPNRNHPGEPCTKPHWRLVRFSRRQRWSRHRRTVFLSFFSPQKIKFISIAFYKQIITTFASSNRKVEFKNIVPWKRKNHLRLISRTRN